MPLYDQHVHSKHSFDSRAEPADIVERAIDLGLGGVTFTEHFDPHPQEWGDCVYDDAVHTVSIERLRKRFGGDIFIGKGIEIGYYRPRMELVLDFVGRHEFDLVVLSVHYFGGRALYDPVSWKGMDSTEGTLLYLETVLEMVRFCESLHGSQGRVFHVLGHLDLVKRYTQRFLGTHDVSRFSDLIDDILCACLAADLVPEVNSSTLRQNLVDPMPAYDTIRRYSQHGGTAMTMGSDAHLSETVGAGLDIAADALAAVGLRQALFKAGVRTDVPVR
ncbi:MAG: histidinol-phosphatase HisJ family protein [Phycisphaerae bacterium]